MEEKEESVQEILGQIKNVLTEDCTIGTTTLYPDSIPALDFVYVSLTLVCIPILISIALFTLYKAFKKRTGFSRPILIFSYAAFAYTIPIVLDLIFYRHWPCYHSAHSLILDLIILAASVSVIIYIKFFLKNPKNK